MARRTAMGSVVILVLAAPLLAGMTQLGVTVPGPVSGSWSTLLATDGAGNLYACDGDALWRLDETGGTFVSIFSGVGTVAGASVDPSGFAVNADGTMAYIATGFSGRLVEVNLDSGFARELAGARALIANYGLAVDPIHGQVFVTDSYTQELSAVDPGGTGSLTSLDVFGGEGAFGGGIAFAPDGMLVVPVPTAYSNWPTEDDFPADLYRFSRPWLDNLAGGTVQTGAGVCYATNVQVSGSGAMAVDQRDHAYLLAVDAIYEVDASGSRSVLAGDPSQNAFDMWGYGFMGLAYDAPGDRLLFAYRETTSQDWTLYEYAVPEPATLGLVALGAAVAVLQRRWRR